MPEPAPDRQTYAARNPQSSAAQPSCRAAIAPRRQRRLRHQLQLLGNSQLSRLGDKLLAGLDTFFDDVQGTIRPSVLHGDLWSGNIASMDGQPAVFDPATCVRAHRTRGMHAGARVPGAAAHTMMRCLRRAAAPATTATTRPSSA